MINFAEWLDFKTIRDVSSPYFLWLLFRTLFPYSLMIIIAIPLILYIFTKKFVIKKSFTSKNYFILAISSVVIYFFLYIIIWLIMLRGLGSLINLG